MIKEDGELDRYVTKVTKNSFAATNAITCLRTKIECKKICAWRSNIEYMLSGQNAVVEEIDQVEAFIKSMQVKPIAKCNKRTESTLKFNITPDLHCIFAGDKVYCYRYNTRELLSVLDANEINTSDFTIVTTDNQKDLDYDDEKFPIEIFNPLSEGVPTIVDTSKFNYPKVLILKK